MTAQDEGTQAARRGQVYAHVGQPFTTPTYDVVVLGAGRMGCLCAHFLLHAAQGLGARDLGARGLGLRVLLLDSGGLPNEEGASLLSPGVWAAADVPDQYRAQAEWTRSLVSGELLPEGGGLPPAPREPAPQSRTLLELLSTPEAGTTPLAELPAHLKAELDPLIDWQAAHRHTPYSRATQALTYNVASLTTRAAQQAISMGADLMLNARAYPTPQGVKIERLTVTNTHEIVVHEVCHVAARQVVIAAGAAGPLLAEQHLGAVTHHAQAYVQYPRVEGPVPTTDTTALVRACGVTLRPYAQGYTALTQPTHPDPYGYQPTAGRLSGVPVGLRRETLQALLEAMPVLGVLGTQGLHVGRSLSDVAGAWVAWPMGGWPLSEPLTERHSLLLGGLHADLTGAAVAREAALQVLIRLEAL